MRIIWSHCALERAAEIADYIAEDNPSAAKKWITQLFEHVKKIEQFPESTRIVHEINDPTIREVVFKNFRIIYEIQNNCINVLTVRRFRQQLDLSEVTRVDN